MKKLTSEQLKQYFSRIHYKTDGFIPDEKHLKALIWHHAMHIPFEGLAPHLGEDITINEIDAIFGKLVTKKRGGWCYEMNGLFFHVLVTLGFDVTLQLASVFEGKWLPPSHAILMVNLSGQFFLVDVGFGNIGLVEPIALLEHQGQMRHGIHYKIIQSRPGEYQYEAGFNQSLRSQYRLTFSEQTLTLNDLIAHNQSIATVSHLPFVQHAVVKIATSRGFKKLVDTQFTEYELQGTSMEIVRRFEIPSFEEYGSVLEEEFTLVLPSDAVIIAPSTLSHPMIRFAESENSMKFRP